MMSLDANILNFRTNDEETLGVPYFCRVLPRCRELLVAYISPQPYFKTFVPEGVAASLKNQPTSQEAHKPTRRQKNRGVAEGPRCPLHPVQFSIFSSLRLSAAHETWVVIAFQLYQMHWAGASTDRGTATSAPYIRHRLTVDG